MKIHGYWYPAGSSERHTATLLLDKTSYQVHYHPQGRISGSNLDLEISQRVGNIPRKILLGNDSIFETDENDDVDHWIASNDQPFKFGRLLHNLESKWRWIMPSLILVMAIGFSGIKWGLPLASEALAKKIPEGVVQQISSSTLSTLDKFFFKSSETPKTRQRQLEKQFYQLTHTGSLSTVYDGDFKLSFRKLGVANAFALPSGEIVVSDKFLELVNNQNQTNSVFLHEIGHVIHNHGLQQVIRSAIVSFIIAMIVGEPSGLEELFTALPVFMLQNQYSRQHEQEADIFALEFMMRNGMDPIHLAEALGKIDSTMGDVKNQRHQGNTNEEQPGTRQSNSDHGDIKEKSFLDFFSTHPRTTERIKIARDYSKRFHQQRKEFLNSDQN